MSKSLIITVLLGIITLSGFIADELWFTDYKKATEVAKKENKLILLRFSGSDWCGNCIKLDRSLFTDSTFISFAEENIVLLNADFPQRKKNQLPEALQQQNDNLAEKFNKEGAFPKVVIIDSKGNLVGTMQYPLNSVDEYINNIKSIIKAN